MTTQLKIGYFADGPWSHEAFELLVADPSISIEFIVPRTDSNDEVLQEYAKQHQIDYLYPVRINTIDFIERVKVYGCDLFISMSFNQIFRQPLIDLPRLSTINCHAGKLPFYRGRNVLNWALINDEKEFGITAHYVDEGIDTGDIILQRSFPITRSDTYATLLQIAYKECASILYETVKLIQTDKHTRIKQSSIHPVGFYCGKRGEGDELINWNQSSIDIFNFIRAICRPGPMATTFSKGSIVKINGAKLVEHAPVYKNTPGQLLSKTKDGFLVKTGDSFIEILEIEADVKLKVGDRLIDFAI